MSGHLSRLPQPLRVLAVEREAAGVATLVIEAGESAPGPGQFSMLYLFGKGEAPISVSGVEDDGAVRYTVRPVGALTRALCALEAGAVVGLRGPFGQGWPAPERGDERLLVAGGIGLAPLRYALDAQLADPGAGAVSLLYGCRTPDEILFGVDHARWRSDPRVRIEVTVDQPSAAWQGAVGFVTERLAVHAFDPQRVVALLCGPPAMVRHTLAVLKRRGVAEDRIHVSLERSMHCAVGLCGHCQWGPAFVCRDGPVFRVDRLQPWFSLREV
ncbi:MAG: FAD/NAD(P)-binding protein [Pseudomonadales bacterium]|jgi:NAD(P)H-flavin reductase|nr:FAD/NAD(P)-binding protein [Pseudomonadales bacterium]